MPRVAIKKYEYQQRDLMDFFRCELKHQKKRQKDLAQYLGVNQGTLSRWLSEEREYGLVALMKTFDFLDVPKEERGRFF